jgi:hypothetical protein
MSHNTVAKCLAGLSVLFLVAAKPALCADDAKFAAPTFESDVAFAVDISPDKKAFTAAFNGLGVKLDGKSAAPVAARTFSFILPLTGAAPGLEVPFFVQGFVLAEKGSNGHLVFSVNDQTVVADFPSGSDKSFVQQLKYKAGWSNEVRITIFLLADRDSASDAGVSLNVTTIDTDIAKHPS